MHTSSSALFSKSKLFLLLLFCHFQLLAQVPAGYYDAAEGKTSYQLKTELFFIIDGHTDRGYSALWDLYPLSDKRADGFVWDIYSDCNLAFGTDQDNGTGGTTECDKYNREHTFPQSWFNSLSTPRADGHMVLPTDKKVNGERGNFPYGEVQATSYTSQNGSLKGSSALAGYTGTVFEPIDEYKGDIARIYFYMATRYEDQIGGWQNNTVEADAVLDGSSDKVYENWTLDMLLAWHENDPVSQKEIDRNEAVYTFQGNRNPFVDRPEFVNCIWKNACGNNPLLEASTSSLNFGNVTFGDGPTILDITLTGSNLSSPVTLTSNASEFTLSNNFSGSYSASLELSPDASGNINTTVYVAFTVAENLDQTVNGIISIAQAETAGINVNLTAQTNAMVERDISINFLTDTLFTTIETPSTTIKLQANKQLTEAKTIALKLGNFQNIFYPAQFETSPAANGTTIELLMQAGDSIAELIINLDTAQLKTQGTKSFDISLLDNNSYAIGDNASIHFTMEGVEPTILSTKNAISNKIVLQRNPIYHELVVMNGFSEASYFIYNASGTVVKKGYGTNFKTLKVDELANGLYWLVIKDVKSDKMWTTKFIKH